MKQARSRQGFDVWNPMKRLCLVGLAALLPLTGLAACTSSSSSNSGKVLSVGVITSFPDLNPFAIASLQGGEIVLLTDPTLVQYNDQNQLAANFATSWTSSGNTWTFTVQPHAKWSDGAPMTAADAAWTFNLGRQYLDGGTAIFASELKNMTSATAPNPTTLVLTFSKPPAEFLSQSIALPILPEHVWAGIPPGKDGANLPKIPTSTALRVAGGPYMVAQNNGTNVILLKANPSFYGPKPKTQNVGIQFFPSEEGLLAALKNGTIAYGNGLLPSDAATLRSAGLDVTVFPSPNTLILDMNAQPASPAPELANVTVRKAIDLAIDRQQIATIAYPGGQPAESLVSPFATDYDSSIQPSFNTAEANQMLDQAGFGRGSGGIRVANGRKMSYTMLVGTDSGGAGARAAQIISSNLSAIGLAVTIKYLDLTTWQNTIFGTNGKYNEFTLALDSGAAGFIDPDLYLASVTCLYLGVFNVSGYCNHNFDSLYREQQVTVDPAQRQAIVYQAQKLAYDDEASIQVVYIPSVDAHQKGWTGFGSGPFGALSPLGITSFDSIHYG